MRIMNKLEELVNELCPDGVKYKRIDELCIITRGRVMSKDYIRDNAGQYPVYSSQTENNGELGKISTYDFEGEYLTWTTDGANAGSVFYRNGKFSVTNVCGLLKVKVDEITTKYLYHILSITAPKHVNKGMGNPKLMSNVMARIKVPLPPLSIQSEIVHILDSFTLLTAELTAELTARQKQYAFYRDYLLDFSDEDVTKKIPDIDCTNVEYKRLGDIAKFTYGYTDKAKDYGDTRFIRITDILDNGYLNPNDAKYINLNEDSKKYLLSKGDLLLARTGATYGKTLYVPNNEKAVYASFLIKIELDNTKILNRYYWHFSKSNLYWKQANKLVSTAGQPQFNTNAVSRVVIPVPPLSVQENIVKILDRFDKLNNDMSEGLPAEIEARKKQYEYYRDTLLSFDDKACSQIVKVERERELTRIKAIKWLKLREIASIIRGGNFQKKDFVEQGKPCIHYGQIYTRLGTTTSKSITYLNDDVYSKSKKAMPNDIVMAVTSENIEDVCKSTVWLGNEDLAVSGHTAIIHPSINSKYLAYYFQTTMFFKQKRKLAHGTKVIEVTPDKLNDIIIPVPPLEEQERIVSILDRFDKLCNDISEGLPAEIEARQKQYEYYRDKLLSFKEKNHA